MILDAVAEPADAQPAETPEADLARREAEYEKFVWDNLRRNYLGNYLHGMLGMTGFRLVNTPTFLPAYLHMVSGSNAIVGLGAGAAAGGRGDLADLRPASRIEHRTKVMPAAMWMGGLARTAILGIAVSGWLLKGNALVGSILGFMLMFGLFMGAQRVVFSPADGQGDPDQPARAPAGLAQRHRQRHRRRARLCGGRYFIGPNLFGNGYGTTFVFAFVLTTLGLWALQLLLQGAGAADHPRPGHASATACASSRG